MKRRYAFLSMLPVFSLLFCLLSVPASANSAIRFIGGMALCDPLSRNAENPVAVTGETLTFRPIDRVWEGEASLPDGALGTVTAGYSLVNTADAPVTLELAFPFGERPYYSAGGEENVLGITADGEALPVVTRLSWSPTDEDFSAREALRWLSDDFILSGGLSPDLPVVRLTLTVPTDAEMRFVTEAPEADAVWRVITPEYYGLSFEKGDALRCEGGVLPGEELTFYFIGKTPEELGFSLRFYDGEALNAAFDGTLNYPGVEALPVTAKEHGRETLTLLRFAKWVMAERALTASDVDAYNAVAAFFLHTPTASLFDYADVFGTGFLHWCVYDLTFAPGQTLVNTVTVPLYPDVDESRRAPEFTYTYLLSPAAGWKSFHDLKVVVETDMVMTSKNESFQKTPTGYEAFFDSLPENELTFSLCRTKMNLPRAEDVLTGLLLLVFGAVLPAALAVLLIVGIVKAIKYRKRKKKNLPQT